MKLNRRTILKYGLAGSLLLGIGGVGLSLQETKRVASQKPLQVLSETEFSILYAIADILLPATGSFPAAHTVQVAEGVDETLAHSHAEVQAEIKQALLLIENAFAGFVLDQRTRPFTQLSQAEQDEALAAWKTSKIMLRRKAFKALNALCSGAYFAAPQTHALVGYSGPPQHILDMRKSMGIQ